MDMTIINIVSLVTFFHTKEQARSEEREEEE